MPDLGHEVPDGDHAVPASFHAMPADHDALRIGDGSWYADSVPGG
jgi:hypothetical protein